MNHDNTSLRPDLGTLKTEVYLPIRTVLKPLICYFFIKFT